MDHPIFTLTLDPDSPDSKVHGAIMGPIWGQQDPGGPHVGPMNFVIWVNIKMSSYQYGKSHCGDKTVIRSSYLHHGISYTGKMTSFYWICPLSAIVSDILVIVLYEIYV